MTKVLYWPVVIEKDADGYFAYCPALQGCYTQGDTYEEIVANIRDAIQLHVADRIAGATLKVGVHPRQQMER